MATSDDFEHAAGPDAEEDEGIEVTRTIQRLRVLFAEIEAEGLPTLEHAEQYYQSSRFQEALRLSARLVVLGAAECQNPSDIVAAAIFLDRTAKYNEILDKHIARLEQTVAEARKLLEVNPVSKDALNSHRVAVKACAHDMLHDPVLFTGPDSIVNQELKDKLQHALQLAKALYSVAPPE